MRERGAGRLELLGVALIVLTAIAFVTPVRNWVGDTYTRYIWSNTFWSGVVITLVATIAFAGSTYLLLYTNLGGRLGFLVAGAGLTGWGVINGFLFVLTVPRGPRPAEFEGLNAFQLRIMSLAMMIGSAILFAMFLTALNRLEAADREEETA
jgi:hypothetical protein